MGAIYRANYSGQRKQRRSNPEDRISSLPDDIILNILSLLNDEKELARTSVLSKKWQHLWYNAVPSYSILVLVLLKELSGFAQFKPSIIRHKAYLNELEDKVEGFRVLDRKQKLLSIKERKKWVEDEAQLKYGRKKHEEMLIDEKSRVNLLCSQENLHIKTKEQAEAIKIMVKDLKWDGNIIVLPSHECLAIRHYLDSHSISSFPFEAQVEDEFREFR